MITNDDTEQEVFVKRVDEAAQFDEAIITEGEKPGEITLYLSDKGDPWSFRLEVKSAVFYRGERTVNTITEP
jgi:hypothetical protein